MFHARVCAILGLALMLAATQAEARELFLSVDSNIGGDSNVFRSSANASADGLFELSPRALVRDTRDTLEYEFSYRPTYQAYFETSGISGFDHYGRADVEWRPTPADTVSFGGSIINSRIVRQIIDEIPSFSPTASDRTILIESDSARTTSSRARFGYLRSFSPAQSGRIDFRFDDIDFNDRGAIDSRGYSVSITSTRVLNERTQAGILFTGRGRDSRARGLQPGSRTRSIDISLSFGRAITPSLQLSARAGPSFIRTKQFTSSNRRLVSNKDISYVADVSLTKRYRLSVVSLQYKRFQSGSGGDASASIVDTVNLTINHQLGREWILNLNLGWSQREQISALDADAITRFQRLSLASSVQYRISREFSILGQLSLQRFENDQSNLEEPLVTDVFVGSITFRYSFDPISF
jgi:hypothetical protein